MQVYCPSTITEAVALRRTHEPSFFLAGGTLVNHRRWKLAGELVSLTRLGLKGIRCDDEVLVLGAMTTLGEVARSSVIRDCGLAFLARGATDLKRMTVRNMATLGGTIGANLGFSDLLPILYALGAEVRVNTGQDDGAADPVEAMGSYLARKVPRPLIVQVRVPIPAAGSRFGSSRFVRSEGDLPTCKAACFVRMEGDALAEVRLAAGILGSSVGRYGDAEAVLVGKKADDALIAEAARKVVEGAKASDDPRGKAAFKKKVLGVMVEDALREALAKGGM